MALQLQKNGILRVRPLEGGIEAWRAQDFPIERDIDQPAEGAGAL